MVYGNKYNLAVPGALLTGFVLKPYETLNNNHDCNGKNQSSGQGLTSIS